MPTEIHSDNYYKFLNAEGWKHIPSNKYIEVRSPFDESIVGFLPALDVEEIKYSLSLIPVLQKQWEVTPLNERVKIIKIAADLLKERKNFFVDLISNEVGKMREESEEEVERTIDLINFYAEQALRISGESQRGDAYPNYQNKKLSVTQRVPLGVVLAIPPFNYPLNETAPKIVSALLMGNACVLKPSTQGGITNMNLVKVFTDAGVPAGVLTALSGKSSEIGDEIVSNPVINAINFTGSYETANHISHMAGIKKLILGLSGKDASIVCEDADMENALKEIVSGTLSYSGQRCTAIKRVLVHEKIHDEFVSKFIAKVSEMKFDPVIDNKAADYIEELKKDAITKGAKLEYGEKESERVFKPYILTNVNENMRVAWEEPFGPIVPIMKFSELDDAINMCNKSEYGLQSSVFTKDINTAFYVAEKLEVGTVQINGKDSRSPDHFPFTGTKKSGLGNVQGARYLLEEVTRVKTVVINL